MNESPVNPSKKEKEEEPAVAQECSGASDEELVEAAKSGDTAAFGTLVERYRGRIFAMLYHMVRNEQDAWDLGQIGFLRAWRSLHRFNGTASFYTWLYRIMTNAAIDWLRKRRPHLELDENTTGAALESAPQSEGSRKLEAAEMGAHIAKAMDKLSAEHRAVVVMKEIDGMQYHEIAEVLECSIGTVMSRLFYARKRLQGMLREIYEEL